MSNKTIFLFIAFFSLGLILKCQTVGVVLSGGGAKGMAHIGVLKTLEEYNIPIDYIAGTSMGAIVGGLYAAGYSVYEIDEILSSERFSDWAWGKLSTEEMYYFRKKDPDPSWLELQFKQDTVFQPILPTNLIPSNQMDIKFLEFFAQANAYSGNNFDSLFIPFRCIASDVYNNEALVCRKGDLARSIRASMTFPLYFKPIEINGLLMYDGGIYNNFPVDVMIEDFNPDVIIGSTVSSNAPPPDVDDLYSQITSMMMDNTNYSIPSGKGVLIEPEVENVELMDFEKYPELVEAGITATESKIDEIQAMVNRRRNKEELYFMRSEFKANLPKLNFENINITGLNSTQNEYVLKSIRKTKQLFSIEQFRDAYFKLLADDIISTIYPTAVYNKKSELFDLSLDISRDKKYEINLGGFISSSVINQLYATSSFKHLSKQAYFLSANINFGRFYSSLAASGRVYFPEMKFGSRKLVLPYYFDLSIAYNRFNFYSSNTDILFDDVRKTYLIQNEGRFRGEFAFPINNSGKLVFGFSAGENINEYYQTDVFLKSDTTDISRISYQCMIFNIEKNSLNFIQYPSKGQYLALKCRYIFSDEKHEEGSTTPSYLENKNSNIRNNYPLIKLEIQKYFTIFNPLNLGIHLEAVYSKPKFLNNYTSTMLDAPAFQPTPHSKTIYLENYRSHSYLAAGISEVLSLKENLDIRADGYMFFPYKKIENNNFCATYGKAFDRYFFTGQLALVYHSLLGPASVSINYFEKDGSKFYFLLSFGYMIFNKNGKE